MLERLFSLDYRRRRLAARVSAGPLRDYLETPFVARKADCRQLEYLALDLETTGLDPKKDAIISFGWVVLRGNRIDLATASHRLVRQHCAIPEASAVIHQITDDAAATGADLATVMAELLPLLAGKVLIAHHARIELGFLNTACEQLYGSGFLIPTIDTQHIAQQWYERRNRSYRPGELRLGNLRNRYNLPRYRAHDALVDALAAAELFLAQLAEREGNHPLPLKDLMLRP
jgi:DNA polymerase-3 subunit epsilon